MVIDVVSDETVRFYRQNYDLIDFGINHGSQEVKKIAMAIKLAVELEEKRRREGERYEGAQS